MHRLKCMHGACRSPTLARLTSTDDTMASAGASPAQFDPEETLAQCARAMKGAHHVTIDAAAAQTFGCSIGKSLKRQFPSGPHRGKPADADVNDAARMLMWNAVRS